MLKHFVLLTLGLNSLAIFAKPQTGCDSQGCYSVNEKGETAKCGPGGCFLAKSHNNQFIAPGDFTSRGGVAACGPGGCFNTKNSNGYIGCGPGGCSTVRETGGVNPEYVYVAIPRKDAICGPKGCFAANRNRDNFQITRENVRDGISHEYEVRPCTGFGCATGNADCGPFGCTSGGARCGPGGCHAPGK